MLNKLVVLEQVYNPPAPAPVPVRPVAPVYNNPPPPPRPYDQAYSNPSPAIATAYGQNPRDQCICVPVEQCPAYDVIGRGSDFAIDPRTKTPSAIVVEEAENATATETQSRRRRRSPRRPVGIRQTIVGDDSITVISADDPSFTPGGSLTPTTTQRPVSGDVPITGTDTTGSVTGAGTGAGIGAGIGAGAGDVPSVGTTPDVAAAGVSCHFDFGYQKFT